jgi:hypothetical protein
MRIPRTFARAEGFSAFSARWGGAVLSAPSRNELNSEINRRDAKTAERD